MAEYIEREAVMLQINIADFVRDDNYEAGATLLFQDDVVDRISSIPAADVRPVPEGGIGEMSDGYHTFNGLYYQRMVLFAALVKAYKDKAWKSHRHEDGELCFGGGWFIVGIDTPDGSYTYHYEDKDWDRFDCVALPEAKHWDGHTEEDVTRLFSLDARPVEWIPVTERLPEVRTWVLCYCRANSFDVFRMTDEGNWQYGNRSIYMKGYVTHWMPLPPAPKEE